MKDYRMSQYETREPFSSFLPGIAGIKGIPMWCYYVNRGQAVVSFGVKDKDHAIMEFYPAHTAYQTVSRMGFRTFVKKDGKVTEAFTNPESEHSMEIGMNYLSISDSLAEETLSVKVTYFILPEEPIAALVRKVEFVNTGSGKLETEVVDGMPAVIPYGVDMTALKEMSETSKAWMQAENPMTGVGFYRVRASMEDSAKVSGIEGGNFVFAVEGSGERLPVIYDPVSVFAYDTAFSKPVAFCENDLGSLFGKKQNTSNEVPCAFFGKKLSLNAGESDVIYEVYGQVEKLSILEAFLGRDRKAAYFEEKLNRARSLCNELTEGINCHTASKEFDAYSRYTYMDNVLRGGYPIRLGDNKIFYVYSRKHGDLERDYNYFSMLPEFYSQGNGNFRDVNQNRRNDAFFSPFVKAQNIHTFYDLIQPDGYNPLGVEMQSYRIDSKDAAALLKGLGEEEKKAILKVVEKPFTPGALAAVAGEDVFLSIMDAAEGKVEGDFKEGYWSDHWDYNLDLIEDYLAVYPEQEEQLLTEKSYTWFAPQARVNPRKKRYEETENGIRQYHALKEGDFETKEKEVKDQNGNVLTASLAEKLLVMSTVKFATLDPYGMGVEMEGGKPGWYDALNGLPGMLGSSMAESCELLRMAIYLRDGIQKFDLAIDVFSEAADLARAIAALSGEQKEAIMRSEGEIIDFWNRSNDIKEAYREVIYAGFSGKKETLSKEWLLSYLDDMIAILTRGQEKAKTLGGEPFATYFYYDVTDYEKDEEGIRPKAFSLGQMPLFLEGSVHRLKLPQSAEEKKELYHSVRESLLFDQKLSMYKVNAALEKASIEIGRCRSFTPGWLENESVWLHMEYKYLLELLKSGMYSEFFHDFRDACVAFLDADTYGRNPLENSSFIASSANPDEKKWGRGFVARLSGSTAEFLSMWRRMFFGEKPFSAEEGKLFFAPAPAIPSYLVPEDGKVGATLLGCIPVTYHIGGAGQLVPGSYEIQSFVLQKGGQTKTVTGSRLEETDALAVRNGEIDGMEIFIA